MPVTIQSNFSTESKAFKTIEGMWLFAGGATYIQYGASTAIANTTTETSIFAGSPSTATFAQQGSANYPASTLQIPGINSIAGTYGGHKAGTMWGWNFYGSIGITGTPNIRVRATLTNSAGTVYTVADTAAVAATNFSGTQSAQIFGNYSVGTYGTSGSINGVIAIVYGGTHSGSIVSPITTVTLDTTASYTFDIKFTWGTQSSSNTFTNTFGQFGVVG